MDIDTINARTQKHERILTDLEEDFKMFRAFLSHIKEQAPAEFNKLRVRAGLAPHPIPEPEPENEREPEKTE